MGWWEGVDETRVLIAPDPSTRGNSLGHLVSLRHPKTGNATFYLIVNGMLQELNWFKHQYGSWFLVDYVCADGRLYTATPVDPIFIMLPIFEEARMKYLGQSNLQLDEIVFIDGSPGYQSLMPILENTMQVVCEIKEIGSSKFYRLDDSKVLTWLDYKVAPMSVLDAKIAVYLNHQNCTNQLRIKFSGTVTDAVSILGEYLKDEPWLRLLWDHFKLDLLEINRKAPEAGIIPCGTENNSAFCDESEEKKCDKRSTRTGRQTKKAKMETNSRNIKEMFTRASSKRKS